MAAGNQGSVPEADGRPVMGRMLSPTLLARGDQYPAGPGPTTAPITAGPGHLIRQAPRPPDPVVGQHATLNRADVPWPTTKGYPPTSAYAGPIPQSSEHLPSEHGTEPLVAYADQWKENWWMPRLDAVQYGTAFPRAVPAPITDQPPPATGSKHNIPHSLFSSMHPTGQLLETRVAFGGHVVIRRQASPTGLPGQTPYYQAPNTLRSGQPPRWDQGILLNLYPNGLS